MVAPMVADGLEGVCVCVMVLQLVAYVRAKRANADERPPDGGPSTGK
jgi:hypothetical protein